MIENDVSYSEVYENIGDYLEESYAKQGAAGGLIAGGVGVNKAMKKSHAQKLAALKASGASAEEIAKTEKIQKRNRVL